MPGPRVVIRLEEEVPAWGARPGDLVSVEPGQSPPVMLLRDLDEAVLDELDNVAFSLVSSSGAPPASPARLRSWLREHDEPDHQLRIVR